MKIVLTGGGTGGHFYPLIAVAEAMRVQSNQDHLDILDLYYYSDVPYDEDSLRAERIKFISIPSGKLGLSYSIFQKLKSVLTVIRGISVAVWKLYVLYPDAVLSKGGYASVPTSIAAWILGIPLYIHESDAAAGRSTIFLSRFAKNVFVSYKSATDSFPFEKVIHTGQPIRGALLHPESEGANELLDLDPSVPVLWVVGGSQGAQKINNLILGMMPDLLQHFQIIHQTGTGNYDQVIKESNSILHNFSLKSRYHPLAYMDELMIRRIAGVADLAITRAGSALFEFAAWNIPTVVVPFAVSNADHSKKNAYSYASHGACTVVEESNLTPEIVRTELIRIISDSGVIASMKQGAESFATRLAAKEIAYRVMQSGYEHTPILESPELPLSVLIERQLATSEQTRDENSKQSGSTKE